MTTSKISVQYTRTHILGVQNYREGVMPEKARERVILDHRYMRVTVREIPRADGGVDEYPSITTAPAASIIAWHRRADGGVNVLLMKQARPEATGQVFLKTFGGYLEPGECHEECVRRNALRKLGVRLQPRLYTQRGTNGFPGVAEFPIPLLASEGWEVVSDPAPGCAREVIDLREAFVLAATGKLPDICTEQSVVHLAAQLLFPRSKPT